MRQNIVLVHIFLTSMTCIYIIYIVYLTVLFPGLCRSELGYRLVQSNTYESMSSALDSKFSIGVQLDY